MRPSPPPDDAAVELLAIGCQLGDASALDELIDRWHEPLWRYARRVTGRDDAASDAVQDAWVRILRALPGLRAPARLVPWLFGITRRVLMDRLRAQYAAPSPIEVDDAVHAAAAAEPGPDDLHLQLDAMERALEKLPVVERDVLVLFYLQDLSLADIADILSVPVGTVKSRLFRARHMLRKEMSHDDRSR
jgi:RNA polymerase sigma-70 factor (ECF subfamily)